MKTEILSGNEAIARGAYEAGVTYANRPAIDTSGKSSGNFKGGTWDSVDVTWLVTGNGTYSLALTGNSAGAISLASRESANAPELVVRTNNAPSPTPTTVPPPPSATATRTATAVPPPPPTSTPTALPPSPTATSTPTNTPPPTFTSTPAVVPPTPTTTSTPTSTATALPPSPTPTNTPTSTPTPIPPSPTATSAPTNTPTAVPPFQPTAPIHASFFYPWFPEAWTQQGINPYSKYEPTMGYYSSIDNAVIDQQITLAAQAHQDAFISSWWGSGSSSDNHLQYILGRSERVGSPNPNLRWAIYYENESQGDPSAAQLTADLQYLASKVFNLPAYLRINGKPVVFVYSWSNDGCGMADRWAEAKRAVGGNVYVVLRVFPGYAACASQPDSWHQYSPAVGFDQQGKLAAVASPGFWLKGNSVRLPRDPVRFESDVKKVAASGAFWQLITTWSEWGEGTIVEPAQEWGNTYIDILTRNFPAR